MVGRLYTRSASGVIYIYNCSPADTNECEGPDQFCAVNATCINTRGSYTCLCKPGFEGDGFHSCSGEAATQTPLG